MAELSESARHPNERRFEEFFAADSYVALKNYLYNYIERKRVINREIQKQNPQMILEVGSGLSPIVTNRDNVIYSELSYRALRTLKELNGRGHYVVADGTRLPFATSALSHVVCSEVLEHVEDDQSAVNELARVVKEDGRVYITVPHRRFYFAADDRFVRHFRRYEIPEMREKLDNAGLRLQTIKKVLGPLEKVTMFTVVMTYSALQRMLGPREYQEPRQTAWGALSRTFVRPLFKWAHRAYALLARADAWLMPRALSTVILFEAAKAGSAPKAESAEGP